MALRSCTEIKTFVIIFNRQIGLSMYRQMVENIITMLNQSNQSGKNLMKLNQNQKFYFLSVLGRNLKQILANRITTIQKQSQVFGLFLLN